MRILISIMLALCTSTALADDKLINLDTRPAVSVGLYYMKRDDATAAVVLLPGGDGDINITNGAPASNNFLVRSRAYFTANGFTVAISGTPTDMKYLGYSARTSPRHVEDLVKVVEFVKRDSGLPVWLVGTSRGTVSATAAAVSFGNKELAGIVLTSSVTGNKRIPGVALQRLEAIRIPVLVMHHAKDACNVCNPNEVWKITDGLKNAPVKKQIMVNGGADPSGDPCGAQHWHGYIGMEKEAVGIISDWIRNPKP
ncbi:MAG: alpha/beta hydrolase [Syntrophales bacterium LBB04]|nr:alpha/beta hydrolase [Syntrophales bacterium LBB04]